MRLRNNGVVTGIRISCTSPFKCNKDIAYWFPRPDDETKRGLVDGFACPQHYTKVYDDVNQTTLDFENQ